MQQQIAYDQQDPAALTGLLPVIAADQAPLPDAPGGPAGWQARHAPPRHDPLPQRQIVIIPAHGGAGASTLVTLLHRMLAAAQAGHGWRAAAAQALPDGDPEQIAASGWFRVAPAEMTGMPLIIAARGNPEGARRAVIAVTTLERRGVWPAAIALVADGAGPEPRQTAQHLDLIGHRAGPVIRVPLVAALRAGAGPGDIRVRGSLHDALIGLLTQAVPEPARARQP
jgi:hypothetical protein